jgi:hypothetical protein
VSNRKPAFELGSRHSVSSLPRRLHQKTKVHI